MHDAGCRHNSCQDTAVDLDVRRLGCFTLRFSPCTVAFRKLKFEKINVLFTVYIIIPNSENWIIDRDIRVQVRLLPRLPEQELPPHRRLNSTPRSLMVYLYIDRDLKTCSTCLDLYIHYILMLGIFIFVYTLFFTGTLHIKQDILRVSSFYEETIRRPRGHP